MAFFCEVSFPLPLLQTFTYRLPENLVGSVRVGSRVLAPFGSRRITGYVLEIKQLEKEPGFEVKEIIGLKEGGFGFSESFIGFVKELSRRSLASAGQLLDLADLAEEPEETKIEVVLTERGQTRLESGEVRGKKKEILELLKGRRLSPVYLKRKTGLKNLTAYLKELQAEGLIEIRERLIKRRGSGRRDRPAGPAQLRLPVSLPLSPENSRIFRNILNREKEEFLVAGSWSRRAGFIGELVNYFLGEGGFVFLLVPEIQRIRRWQELFGHLEKPVILHSQLPPARYREAIERIKAGQARLIVGTRHLVLLPVHPVSLIIVDEEQDELYYQTEGVPFDAKEAARVRAGREKAVVIFTSSSPEVCSYYRHHRDGTLVDLGQETRNYSYQIISGDTEKLLKNELKDEVKSRVEKSQTIFIYVNKKGYAGYVQCSRCRYVPRCERCRIAFSASRPGKDLFCRYCGMSSSWPEKCPSCGGKMRAGRFRGSQFFREELSEVLPGKNIVILEEGNKNPDEETLLKSLKTGKVAAVIGTEYALPRLWPHQFQLVIAVNPETGLNRPDFRAAETVFESLSRVAELVANEKKARLVVVTDLPEELTLKQAVLNDYRGFIEKELEMRKLLNYPPFFPLVNVSLSAPRMRSTARLSRRLLEQLENRFQKVEIIGPKVFRQVWHRERKEIRFYLRFLEREELGAFTDFLYEFKKQNPAARLTLKVWT